MILEELAGWDEQFMAFHARFTDLFVRSEPREQSAKYLRGLLSAVERKNGWQLAEAVADRRPDRTERLLYSAAWDADEARDRLIEFVLEKFGHEQGIGVLDETGFLKKGTKSAGVARQYSGTAGKVENCQIGTFLSYATPRGHVLLDRALYLPQSWCEDPQRRLAAKIPEEVVFHNKPQQAVAMLRHAWEMGVRMRYVTGDEVYGNSPELREAIDDASHRYVLAVSRETLVWTSWPKRSDSKRKRREAQRLLPEPERLERSVQSIAASFPQQRFRRFSVAEGEKGPRLYDWARQRLVVRPDTSPARWGWLLVRRSVSDPTELAYYLSNAPSFVSLRELAEVAATRYTVEQCFEEAKGEAGLDQYEVRYWHSWYRHITLSMMAHAFLGSIRSDAERKKSRPRLGRAQRGRSEASAGAGAAFAGPLRGADPELVALSPSPSSGGSAQPLPASSRSRSRSKP